MRPCYLKSSGEFQCSSNCNSDFDCKWGQVCKNGVCAENADVHWKCEGVFKDPCESCKRHIEHGGEWLKIKLYSYQF